MNSLISFLIYNPQLFIIGGGIFGLLWLTYSKGNFTRSPSYEIINAFTAGISFVSGAFILLAALNSEIAVILMNNQQMLLLAGLITVLYAFRLFAEIYEKNKKINKVLK